MGCSVRTCCLLGPFLFLVLIYSPSVLDWNWSHPSSLGQFTNHAACHHVLSLSVHSVAQWFWWPAYVVMQLVSLAIVDGLGVHFPCSSTQSNKTGKQGTKTPRWRNSWIETSLISKFSLTNLSLVHRGIRSSLMMKEVADKVIYQIFSSKILVRVECIVRV